VTTTLDDRYGAPARWRRPVAIALTALVAGVALVWLGWVAWFHGTPAVESELIGFEVGGDHQVTARLQVTLEDDVEATCRLRAYADDHTTVGELAFTPTDGLNEVVVRTERRATTVEKLGCTAPGQNRPR
jgi:hypothetical protein